MNNIKKVVLSFVVLLGFSSLAMVHGAYGSMYPRKIRSGIKSVVQTAPQVSEAVPSYWERAGDVLSRSPGYAAELARQSRQYVTEPLLDTFRGSGQWLGGYLPTGTTGALQQTGRWLGETLPAWATTEGAKEAAALAAVAAVPAETARRMYYDPTRKYSDLELREIESAKLPFKVDITPEQARTALIRRGYYRVDPRRYAPFVPKFGIPSLYRAYRSRVPWYLGGFSKTPQVRSIPSQQEMLNEPFEKLKLIEKDANLYFQYQKELSKKAIPVSEEDYINLINKYYERLTPRQKVFGQITSRRID